MRELPILFSSPMVRAILDGRKSQTRRVIKPQPVKGGAGYPFAQPGDWAWQQNPNHAIITADPALSDSMPCYCPYGRPASITQPAGDRLWVRETWAPVDTDGDALVHVAYRHGVKRKCATSPEECAQSQSWIELAEASGRDECWRPSIHMPRWASRITLEVTEVRVQRLAHITEEDAEAEGVEPSIDLMEGLRSNDVRPSYRWAFRALWDSINGQKAPWSSNPWCWAISFRRLP